MSDDQKKREAEISEFRSELEAAKKKAKSLKNDAEGMKALAAELNEKAKAITRKQAAATRKKRDRQRILWGVVIAEALKFGRMDVEEFAKICKEFLTDERNRSAALEGLKEFGLFLPKEPGTIRVRFPDGKPDPEVIAKMKAAGASWAWDGETLTWTGKADPAAVKNAVAPVRVEIS